MDSTALVWSPENPREKENMFTLTNTHPFRVKTYFEEKGINCFEVVFGRCLGLD